MVSFVDCKGSETQIGPIVIDLDVLILLKDRHGHTIKKPNSNFPPGHKRWNADGWSWAAPEWKVRYKPGDTRKEAYSPGQVAAAHGPKNPFGAGDEYFHTDEQIPVAFTSLNKAEIKDIFGVTEKLGYVPDMVMAQ